jgi:cytochrome c peroxidase
VFFRLLLLFVCSFATCVVFSQSPEIRNGDVAMLGKLLFSEKALSADGTVSCASCHQPDHAFAEKRQTSIGVHGLNGNRNAPSLLNVGEQTSFFWDGRQASMREAVTDPLFTSYEMGLGNEAELVQKLKSAGYGPRFAGSFGGPGNITEQHVQDALLAYVKTLSAIPERPTQTADAQAVRRGREIFEHEGECASCHAREEAHRAYTDGAFHPSALGAGHVAEQLPTLTAQTNQADSSPRSVAELAGRKNGTAELGRFLVTHSLNDINTYRTPSLLHVAQTAPYMHDGSVATLEQAVQMEVYYRGLATGQPIQLTASQRSDLLTFLRTL